jgi:hypothetical protein
VKILWPQSRRTKILTLLIILFVADRCWVSKSYSFAAAIPLTELSAQAISYAAYLTVVAYQAYQNWQTPTSTSSSAPSSAPIAIPPTATAHAFSQPTTLATTELIQKTYESIPEVKRHAILQETETLVNAIQEQERQSYTNHVSCPDYARLNNFCNQLKNENKWLLAPVPNGARLYAPDQDLYVGLTIRPVPETQAFIDACNNYLADQEKFLIHWDQELLSLISDSIARFVENGEKLVYGTTFEQINALLNIVYFKLNGLAYGMPLLAAQRALYYDYFHRDGSICVRALKNTLSAQQTMHSYPGYDCSHCSSFLKQGKSQKHKKCPNTFWWARSIFVGSVPEDFHETVQKNSLNHTYQQMLTAFAQGNIDRVHFLGKQFKSDSEGALIYKAIKDVHDEQVKIHEKSLRDEYGIYHFNLPVAHRDPL